MNDLRAIGLLAAGLFVIGSLPWLAGHVSVPDDRVFAGILFNVPDHAQYFSWITASREGLFIANTMTPEPNAPVFMNPMMWLLSRIERVFGLSFPAIMQAWRALAVVVLAAGLVVFGRSVLPDAQTRRTALAIAVLGSGFGWILVLVKYVAGLPDVPFPHDIYTAEPNTLFASYAYPYLALAQGLVVLAIVGAWLAATRRSPGWGLVGVLASLALALSHAYDLLTVYAVVGLMATWALVEERRLPMAWVAVGAAIALTSGPVALYYYRLTAGDPLWQAILAQYPNAGVWTPPHWHLVMLMGLPLLLAVPSLGFRHGGAVRLLSIWAVAGLALIYLPVVFQIKLLTAWQFPLAALAAITWHRQVWPWVARHLPQTAARPVVGLLVVAALVVPTNLYLGVWRVIDLRRHELPYFLHQDEREVLDWLAHHATGDDVVIAPLALGQFVPNLGGTRAFVAHWAMTNRFFERREAAERFFDPSTPDDSRLALAEREGITMAVASRSTAPGAVDSLRASPAFEPVFERESATVFRLRRPMRDEERRP